MALMIILPSYLRFNNYRQTKLVIHWTVYPEYFRPDIRNLVSQFRVNFKSVLPYSKLLPPAHFYVYMQTATLDVLTWEEGVNTNTHMHKINLSGRVRHSPCPKYLHTTHSFMCSLLHCKFRSTFSFFYLVLKFSGRRGEAELLTQEDVVLLLMHFASSFYTIFSFPPFSFLSLCLYFPQEIIGDWIRIQQHSFMNMQ